MFGSSRDSRRHSSALLRKLARISAGRTMPVKPSRSRWRGNLRTVPAAYERGDRGHDRDRAFREKGSTVYATLVVIKMKDSLPGRRGPQAAPGTELPT